MGTTSGGFASPPVTFVPPMAFLRRVRRVAAVVAASAALGAMPARGRIVFAATPTQSAASSVLFDKAYTGSGATGLWSDVGIGVRLTPDAPTPQRGVKSAAKRILVEDEIRILMRLVVAATVGGIIGVERRSAKSFAGVRTFSLVSLGAAIFMSTCLVAFPNADPARIAAAVSSSVGFIGGGVMSKNSKHSRGLTTATSVWLAAGLGLAAASGLFVMAYVGSIMTVVIARYARFDNSLHLIRGDPLAQFEAEHDDVDDIDEEEEELIRARRKQQREAAAAATILRQEEEEQSMEPFSGNGSPSEVGRRGT